jgi:hypothetical protein
MNAIEVHASRKCVSFIFQHLETTRREAIAVIGAALWRPYSAYDFDELPHLATAKSPYPDQEYLAPDRTTTEEIVMSTYDDGSTRS